MWFFHLLIYIFIILNFCYTLQVLGTMKSEEVIEKFGVPRKMISSYEFVSLNYPIVNRRKRDTSLTLEIERKNGEKIILNLVKSEGLLADKNTRIFEAYGDDSGNVEYKRDEKAMEEMGNFTAYHDHGNKAAIIFFENKDTLEGMIGNQLILRAISEDYAATLSADDRFNLHIDRSVKYMLIETKKFPGIVEAEENFILDDRDVTNQERFYLQLLIVLDYGIVGSRSSLDVIKSILVFWNSVDMLYSNITQPRISINIAGIVLSKNDEATPYINIAMRGMRSIIISTAADGFSTHFYGAEKDFPFDSYDYAFLMTSYTLCRYFDSRVCHISGRARKTIDCLSRIDPDGKQIQGTGILHYDYFSNSYGSAAHELGHLLSMDHDQESEGCDGIGSPKHGLRSHKLNWSQCTLNSFAKFFRERNVSCFADPQLPPLPRPTESDPI